MQLFVGASIQQFLYLAVMPAEFLSIHPLNPEPRKINRVVEVLQNGGIVIYPTDTIYGIGCDLMNRRRWNAFVKS